MSKYGKKFTCWSCSTKFYDLNKPHPKCPKCGSDPAADPNLGGAAAPVAEEAEFAGDLDEDVAAPDIAEEEEEADLEEVEEPEEEEEEY